jgi:agmatine deiminase
LYPHDLNYSMPAEWDRHQRTLIAWPVKESMVYPEDFAAVCRGYAEIIEAIADFEPVTVIVNPEDRAVPPCFIHHTGIEYLYLAHNDSWLRDNGPTYVVNDQGDVAGINWHFNAWGGKYSPWDLDDELAPQILASAGMRCFDAPLVMEGGSIHVDGEGTMLTTEECLLNPNRNPHLSRAQIEDYLAKFLGVKKVIWLKKGLSGDETDGHVDNIACFAAPGKVILQVCADPAEANYAISQENREILSRAADAWGRKLEIITIKQPPPVIYKEKSLTLSYLNFYFVNKGLILPIFGGRAEYSDFQAIQTLSELFPNRRIRPVDGMAIIREGGNVHCMTQQVPAGKS